MTHHLFTHNDFHATIRFYLNSGKSRSHILSVLNHDFLALIMHVDLCVPVNILFIKIFFFTWRIKKLIYLSVAMHIFSKVIRASTDESPENWCSSFYSAVSTSPSLFATLSTQAGHL